MELSAKCVKYELDEWELCKYIVKCNVNTCVNNYSINQDQIILKEKPQ